MKFTPHFADQDTGRQSRLTALIAIVLGVSSLCFAVAGFVVPSMRENQLYTIIIAVSLAIAYGLVWLRQSFAAALLVVVSLLVVTFLGGLDQQAMQDGAFRSANAMTICLCLSVAALLMPWWCTLPLAGVYVTASFLIASQPMTANEAMVLLVFALMVSGFAFSMQRTIKSLRVSQAQMQQTLQDNEQLNQELTAQLTESAENLSRERLLRSTISQLSVPVQRISSSTLLIPLIGHVDTLRAQEITTAVLDAIYKTRASHVLLDLQGVSVVDTAVARSLDQLIQAIRLLGAQPALTGIGANMAATMTRLGLHFDNTATYADISAALDELETRQTAVGV